MEARTQEPTQWCEKHWLDTAQLSGRLSAGMLLTYDEIISGAAHYQRPCGIYFLIIGAEIVYVGQSKNVVSRLDSHYARFKFTRYAFAPFPERHLDLVESLYIHLLRPRFNGLETLNGTRRPAAPISIERLLDMALAAEQSLPQQSMPIGHNSDDAAASMRK